MNKPKVYRDPRIKVVIQRYWSGAWVVEPLNTRLNKALKRHCAEMSDCGCDIWRGNIHIQEDWKQDEFAKDLRLSNAELGEISNGWPVTKLMDPELFLNMVGYDAHLITW